FSGMTLRCSTMCVGSTYLSWTGPPGPRANGPACLRSRFSATDSPTERWLLWMTCIVRTSRLLPDPGNGSGACTWWIQVIAGWSVSGLPARSLRTDKRTTGHPCSRLQRGSGWRHRGVGQRLQQRYDPIRAVAFNSAHLVGVEHEPQVTTNVLLQDETPGQG